MLRVTALVTFKLFLFENVVINFLFVTFISIFFFAMITYNMLNLGGKYFII